jgi:hypothetical protein
VLVETEVRADAEDVADRGYAGSASRRAVPADGGRREGWCEWLLMRTCG